MDIFKNYLQIYDNIDLAQDLYGVCKDVLDKTPKNNQYPNGKTTYFDKDIIKEYEKQFLDCSNWFIALGYKFLETQEFDTSKIQLVMNDFWVSEMNQNGFHEAHTHTPGSLISGNFYIHCPKDSASINFYRPEWLNDIFTNLPKKNYNAYNSTQWNIPAKVGRCLMWRSDLTHSVNKNSNDSRIAISFNLIGKTADGQVY